MNLENKWIAIEPGVMALEHTKFRIVYQKGSSVPFRVQWDGEPIPDHAHSTLSAAQRAAEAWIDSLMTMGFEI